MLWESGESEMRGWGSCGLGFAFGFLKSMREVGSCLLGISPSTSL